MSAVPLQRCNLSYLQITKYKLHVGKNVVKTMHDVITSHVFEVSTLKELKLRFFVFDSSLLLFLTVESTLYLPVRYVVGVEQRYQKCYICQGLATRLLVISMYNTCGRI